MNNVLITGINGQDGVILTSKLLKLSKDINILGTSRTPDKLSFLNKISIFNEIKDLPNVNIIDVDFFDTKQLNKIITNFRPDTVFNLMGPSNVNESINNEDYYFKNIYLSFECLVKQLNQLNKKIKFFQASSSEMFGESSSPLNEQSHFLPRNPYSSAKYAIKESIENNKLDVKNIIFLEAIMFNHDSELRSRNFLIMKIISDTIDIYKKKIKKSTVGSLDYIRDWSYAGDVMDAAIQMLKLETNHSFVVGSGIGTSIEKLLDITFSEFNLEWHKFVEVDNNLLRKNDPLIIVSDPSKIENKLGWSAKYSIDEMIRKFIKYKMDVDSKL
jgi:GDPmannose 4,6-dehydratase